MATRETRYDQLTKIPIELELKKLDGIHIVDINPQVPVDATALIRADDGRVARLFGDDYSYRGAVTFISRAGARFSSGPVTRTAIGIISSPQVIEQFRRIPFSNPEAKKGVVKGLAAFALISADGRLTEQYCRMLSVAYHPEWIAFDTEKHWLEGMGSANYPYPHNRKAALRRSLSLLNNRVPIFNAVLSLAEGAAGIRRLDLSSDVLAQRMVYWIADDTNNPKAYRFNITQREVYAAWSEYALPNAKMAMTSLFSLIHMLSHECPTQREFDMLMGLLKHKPLIKLVSINGLKDTELEKVSQRLETLLKCKAAPKKFYREAEELVSHLHHKRLNNIRRN